ncbi:methylated-DNA--[protein]-cysteine S-methyltransferase [Peptoniphilus equinus]|uniref:Methylated-DNA--protein-cysteine methyltransferase n=1 Tax=Peptoniphilus equinus TaxID=3016343 RepID=A0ABY7QUK9_9FIRM|nr:methylated-DNA--[protein]-cysteine S-methyltransferase [Peptoniphilus equinus]WBW50126.1 methylated-DNA--[protein]-cysteine S-methyltransferase [Peptoniphilus equinus]
MIYRRTIASPIGFLTLTASDNVLTGLTYAASDADDVSPVLLHAENELAAYFKGELTRFTVPIALTGTPFQQDVYRALLSIPYGETRSYKDIAVMIRRPKAVRAVGGANHNNPIAIIVPCHRVIGINGHLVGYGGGVEKKRALLTLEQTHLSILPSL